MLPSLVAEPPTGSQWIHEVKHDGYRTLIQINDGTAAAFTRNCNDWTSVYPRNCRCGREAQMSIGDCRRRGDLQIADRELVQAGQRVSYELGTDQRMGRGRAEQVKSV